MDYYSSDGYGSDGYGSDDYNNGYNNNNNGYNDENSNYDNYEDQSSNEYNNHSESDDQMEYDIPFYAQEVPPEQFEKTIDLYLDDQRRDRNSLIRYPNFFQLKKQMYRVHTRASILFCIDIEAWEQDHSKVTEIGVAIYDPQIQALAQAPDIKNFHMSIEENLHLRNGKYVPDNRDNFMGKNKWTCSLEGALKIVRGLIDRYFGQGQKHDAVLVGHGLKNDLRWLAQLGISIPGPTRELDTQTLYSYTHGRDGASLARCLKAVNQPAGYLHNAGNDAYYTLLLALKLCDPCVRWENRLDYNINNHEAKAVTNATDVIQMFS